MPRATHLVVRIAGERMYLWRAVDDEGEMLDILVFSVGAILGQRWRRPARALS